MPSNPAKRPRAAGTSPALSASTHAFPTACVCGSKEKKKIDRFPLLYRKTPLPSSFHLLHNRPRPPHHPAMNPPPPQPPQPQPPPLPPANTLLTLSVSCQTDATTHRALAQLAATGPSPVSHPWPVLDMVVGDRGFVVGVVSMVVGFLGGSFFFSLRRPAHTSPPPFLSLSSTASPWPTPSASPASCRRLPPP